MRTIRNWKPGSKPTIDPRRFRHWADTFSYVAAAYNLRVKRIQLYLEEDLWKTLHIVARQSGSTISELVRTALREKYLGDAAKRKEALHSAIGLWGDRNDLPDTEQYIRGLRNDGRLRRISR